jgi:hypothetical protein
MTLVKYFNNNSNKLEAWLYLILGCYWIFNPEIRNYQNFDGQSTGCEKSNLAHGNIQKLLIL